MENQIEEFTHFEMKDKCGEDNVRYVSSNLPNLESISQGVCTISSTSIDIYEYRELINVAVLEDRVEITYVERTRFEGHPPVRVFKRIYKYDGKLMPDPEVVYGKVISATEERYEF